MVTYSTAPEPSPWHAGEVALQQSAGMAERMAVIGGQVIRDHLTAQHRAFFELLPFAVLGAVDAAGDVWATLRAGQPGFLHAPDPHRLHLAMPRDETDPAEAGLQDGSAIALLGIDLATRRRNRLNGVVQRSDAGGFDLVVRQSFGNCPQYIQLRDTVDPPAPPADRDGREVLTGLDAGARQAIAAADTFFVASYVDVAGADVAGSARQVDVSHRGGKPGFVRVDADGGLTIPDFSGNRFFNTLGNIVINPRAGLVFPDFTTGDLLQMTGSAEVVLQSPELAAFQGAERLWRFYPRAVVRRRGALPLRWTFRGA